jgi:hypothetical protein
MDAEELVKLLLAMAAVGNAAAAIVTAVSRWRGADEVGETIPTMTFTSFAKSRPTA